MAFTSSQRHQPSSQNLASASSPTGFQSGVANDAMRVHPRITASEWLNRGLIRRLTFVENEADQTTNTFYSTIYRVQECEQGPQRYVAVMNNPGERPDDQIYGTPVFTLHIPESLMKRNLLKLGYYCPSGELRFFEPEPRPLRLNEDWLMRALELAEPALSGRENTWSEQPVGINAASGTSIGTSSATNAIEANTQAIVGSLLRAFPHSARRFYRHRVLTHPTLQGLRELTLNTDEEDISPRRLAKTLKVSERSLYSLVRHQLGMSLGAFMTVLKIECICEHLLSHPGASISQLSYLYGFSNHGRFSSHYRNHLGENPSATLRHHRAHSSLEIEPG